ncbi:MAG: diacylglycerol kinase family protein [Desulfobacteria bacterium]
MKKIHILINPVAGGRKCKKLYPAVLRRLGESGVTCDVTVSQYPGQITDLASGLAARGCETVVVCGGDGTVNEVINGIVGTDTALGVVPLGTANDFAANMGIKDINSACAVIMQRQTKKIDLVRVNHDKFFAGTACLGFDAEVAAFARSRRVNPLLMHVVGGLLKFFSYKPKTVELRFDGQKCFGDIFLVAFSNIRSYAKGMLITPEAEYDDARLDICVVKAMPKRKVLSIFPSVYKGKHVKYKGVTQYRTEAVFIQSMGPMDLYADGDFIASTPVRLEVVPKCLEVIVGPPPS